MKRLFLSAVALLGLVEAIWFFLPPSREVVERVYARGFYPVMTQVTAPIGDLASIPLGASLVLVVGLIVPGTVVRRWRTSRSSTGLRSQRRLVGLARAVAVVTILVYGLFLVVWGANYRRLSVESQLDLGRAPVTSDRLRALAEDLLARIVDDLPLASIRSRGRAEAAVRLSFDDWLRRVFGSSAPRLPNRVKAVPPGLLLTFGTSGMLLPILNEPLVDSGLSDTARVATAAHEWAHAAGFAGEAEADAIGLLVGLQAPDPFARYSCALSAFVACVSSMSGEDRRVLLAGLPEAAREDLRSSRAAVLRYRNSWLSSAQRVVHDAYLRSQGVRAGVADYSRAVTLLVRAHAAGYLAPRGV